MVKFIKSKKQRRHERKLRDIEIRIILESNCLRDPVPEGLRKRRDELQEQYVREFPTNRYAIFDY